METRYAVRLKEAVEQDARPAIAAKVAPRFGVEAAKIERLLARRPGVITRATSFSAARRVADVFLSAGAQVDVVPAGEGEPRSLNRYDAQAGHPFPFPEASPSLTRRQEDSAVGVMAPETGVDIPKWAASSAATFDESFDIVAGARSQEAAGARTEGRFWRAGRGESFEDSRLEGADVRAGSEPAEARRGASLRFRFVMAALLPALVALIGAAALSEAGLLQGSGALTANVGDNVAQMLAADTSTFITENGLAFDDPEDRELVRMYFDHRLRAFGSALHEVVAVQLTDPAGEPITGYLAEGADLSVMAPVAQMSAQASIEHAEFGDSAERLAASLPDRTFTHDSVYVVGAPLINALGTVQVVGERAPSGPLELSSRHWLAALAAVTLLVGVLSALALSAGVVTSLRRIVGAAERIALGELDEPIEAEGSAETRGLATALERMRVSLQSAVRDLRRARRAP